MIRSFFWHMKQVFDKVKLRIFRKRWQNPGITFTVADRTESKYVYGGSASEQPIKLEQGSGKRIRLATFNVAFFSLAPAVPRTLGPMESELPGANSSRTNCDSSSTSLSRRRFHFTTGLEDQASSSNRFSKSDEILFPKCSVSPLSSWHASPTQIRKTTYVQGNCGSRHTIYDVLREADADLVALQEVKADESEGMKPLSELAHALHMHYAFAETWAPEFGNAVLSRWPIKRWHVQKLADDSDFRNMLKVVVEVPSMGEFHFCCTHLDHLDENFRLKQVTSLLNSLKDHPHILAGDLNVLSLTDYSKDRWKEIAKLREENGKMSPRGDVMCMLKEQGYNDAVGFSGDSEFVVILPPGQEVQGTCKCGTRVDYILASPSLPYEFIPGSYSIVSSKRTSDHHLVKVDIQLKVR